MWKCFLRDGDWGLEVLRAWGMGMRGSSGWFMVCVFEIWEVAEGISVAAV